ncbi:MAG TPA: glycoside hydrolase domain-containing protein [Puia sp.]
MYIQSVEWNGKPYQKSYILHKDMLKGGVLKIRMGPKPNEHFGSSVDDRPRSVYP